MKIESDRPRAENRNARRSIDPLKLGLLTLPFAALGLVHPAAAQRGPTPLLRICQTCVTPPVPVPSPPPSTTLRAQLFPPSPSPVELLRPASAPPQLQPAGFPRLCREHLALVIVGSGVLGGILGFVVSEGLQESFGPDPDTSSAEVAAVFGLAGAGLGAIACVLVR